ncbi:hypothetical protein, partial [Lutibacter maritimus]
MKKIFVFLFSISTAYFLQAQTFINYNTLSGKDAGATVSAYINNNSEMSGSFYLYENWENNATVLFKNEEVLIKNINFDALRGKFVSQISTDSVFVFYNLDKVFILGKTFININNKYYQSLDSSNPENGFLKEYYIKEIKPEVHVISNKVLKPGEKKLMHKYYMYLNNTLTEINLKKKDIL